MKYALMLTILLSLVPASSLADDLDKINAKKQIIIGVRESSPPFGFYDKAKGSVSGYDIEFAQFVTKKMGLTPIFRTVEPADRIPALKEGRVDIMFASFGKNRDREKEVDFSIGYYVGIQKMVAKKGQFRDLLQLGKMTVCVPKGTVNAKYLQDLSPTVQIRYFEDYTEVFTALREGKCEYASGPEATMLGNLLKMPGNSRADFELSEVPIACEVYGAGIRKGEKRLQQAINDALIEAEKSGEAARIFDRWFGANAVQLNRFFKITK